MNPGRVMAAISGLRWTVGIVVLIQSIHFLISAGATHDLAAAGFAQWLRPALGGFEIVAAVIFLATGGGLIGGFGLLSAFSLAIVVHLLQLDYNILNLLVYCMAVVVCMVSRARNVEVMA